MLMLTLPQSSIVLRPLVTSRANHDATASATDGSSDANLYKVKSHKEDQGDAWLVSVDCAGLLVWGSL